MSHQLTRRQILAGSLAFPAVVSAQNQNSKLQVGFVAVGGRAGAHTGEAHKEGCQCVAFAEVDKTRWGGVHGKDGWKDAKGYTDWREMFTNHGKELDVVFVATPDHTHFAPSYTAVAMGIHCYTEKPLTWSVDEANQLTEIYKKKCNVVTQMGNQGHGGQGWRMAYEYIKGGAVGDVLEFHTWTNRPVWPQGGNRPKGSTPVPAHLDWESWIGPAPMRPYVGPKEGDKKARGPYHPFNWRGVADFGSGALGDMACHTTDGIYAIMDCGYAQTVEPIMMTGPVTDQFPAGMTVKATYRAKANRPGFTTYWYEGKTKDGKNNMPETPEELKVDGVDLPRTGNLIIGTKGKMLVEGDYWNSPRVIPNARRREFGRPEQLLERSPGHHKEFFMACRGEKPREFSQSNFSYSGPMTSNIQSGNLCVRAGKKIELDEYGKILDAEVAQMSGRKPRCGHGPIAGV